MIRLDYLFKNHYFQMSNQGTIIGCIQVTCLRALLRLCSGVVRYQDNKKIEIFGKTKF